MQFYAQVDLHPKYLDGFKTFRKTENKLENFCCSRGKNKLLNF